MYVNHTISVAISRQSGLELTDDDEEYDSVDIVKDQSAERTSTSKSKICSLYCKQESI